MVRAVLSVQTHPASPDREAEYHRWYDDVHLAEVLALPGMTAASRFRADDGSFVALYEYEADDPQSVLAALGSAMADGRITLSDAVAGDPPPVIRVLTRIT